VGSRLLPLAKCLLVILFSLSGISVTAVSRVHAAPAAAIIVYSHGFAEQVNYTQKGHFIATNITSTFTQDDRFVYAFFTAALASANVTWEWYDPSGQLFLNQTQQLQCDYTPCTFVYYFNLRYSAARTLLGLWTMTLRAGGVDLYSDHFLIIPVIPQDVHWDFEITHSIPPRAHGSLQVTIHPSNKTWSSYLVYLPFAANVTAHDSLAQHALDLIWNNKTGEVLVNFGQQRSDGYQFIVNFDIAEGLWQLGSGVFVFRWFESGWGTFNDGYHTIPETLNVSLPTNATLLDVVPINSIALNPHVAENNSRSVVGITETLGAGENFGWTMLYNDSSNLNTQTNSASPSSTPTAGALNAILAQPIPVLPLTLGGLSLWTAVMSIFLLVGSELLAPAYGRTRILINRRRLRFAALTLATIFIAVTAYAIYLQQSLTQIGR